MIAFELENYDYSVFVRLVIQTVSCKDFHYRSLLNTFLQHTHRNGDCDHLQGLVAASCTG